MRKIVLGILCTSLSFCGFSQTTWSVVSIPALYAETIPASVQVVTVTDSLSGGTFNKYIGTLPVDTGVIICDASGVKFKRVLQDATNISPLWWGARGDATTDDLPALNKAVNYLLSPPYYQGGTIDFGKRIFRTTDRFVIGNVWISESDCYKSNIVGNAPSYNSTEYIKAVGKNQVRLIGNGGGIYGDFNPTSLRAIIYYAVNGDVRSWRSTENYIGEVSISIYGRGSFINGVPNLKANSTGYTYNDDQIGLLCLYSNKMKIHDNTVYGVKDAYVLNNSYFFDMNNNYIKLCDRGIYPMQSHESTMSNTTIYYTKKGSEIRSGQMKISNYYAANCPIGMQAVNGTSDFSSIYLECPLLNNPNGQFIVGMNSTDSSYDANYVVEGLNISSLTIACSNSDGSNGLGIAFRNTARGVKIDGGTFPSVSVTRENNLTELLMTNCWANIPSWAYSRDALVTADSVSTTKGIRSGGKIYATDAVITGSVSSSNIGISGNATLGGILTQSSNLLGSSVYSKVITGISGSTDYIIKLGRYSSFDGSRIVGTINILGSNQFTSSGIINIYFVHGTTGLLKCQMDSKTDLKYLTVDLVKYTSVGEDYVGIRFKTNSSTAYIPIYFLFDGVMTDNNLSLSTIASSAVTGIVNIDASVDSRNQIITNLLQLNVNQINTPNFKSPTPGVKKGVYVDEFGNWSIQ